VLQEKIDVNPFIPRLTTHIAVNGPKTTNIKLISSIQSTPILFFISSKVSRGNVTYLRITPISIYDNIRSFINCPSIFPVRIMV